MWSRSSLTGSVSSDDQVVLTRELLEGVGDAVGPGVDPDRRDVAPAHDAVAVDHEQGALAGAVLLAVDAVGLRDLALGLEVGEQREVEVAVLREREVRPDAVDRDPQQLRAVALELRQQLLVGASWSEQTGPVLRIEDEMSAGHAAVGERRLLVEVAEGEVRRRRPGRQRRRLLVVVLATGDSTPSPNGMTRRADRGIYSRGARHGPGEVALSWQEPRIFIKELRAA
jgi:hypothetical protein